MIAATANPVRKSIQKSKRPLPKSKLIGLRPKPQELLVRRIIGVEPCEIQAEQTRRLRAAYPMEGETLQ